MINRTGIVSVFAGAMALTPGAYAHPDNITSEPITVTANDQLAIVEVSDEQLVLLQPTESLTQTSPSSNLGLSFKFTGEAIEVRTASAGMPDPVTVQNLSSLNTLTQTETPPTLRISLGVEHWENNILSRNGSEYSVRIGDIPGVNTGPIIGDITQALALSNADLAVNEDTEYLYVRTEMPNNWRLDLGATLDFNGKQSNASKIHGLDTDPDNFGWRTRLSIEY